MDKYLNLPTILLLSFMIRILATGAGFGEALVIIALSAIYILHLYLDSKKQIDINKEFKDRLISLEEQHASLRDKVSSVGLSITRR